MRLYNILLRKEQEKIFDRLGYLFYKLVMREKVNSTKKPLYSDIEKTIDALIETSTLLKAGIKNGCDPVALEALEKTHESLLARLMHKQSEADQDKKEMIRTIRKEELAIRSQKLEESLDLSLQKRARARRPSSKSRG